MPKLQHFRKVLVIGSGPIIIGQAAEFDYSGTQACLALKEEGIEVILVNNNPATIMTDRTIADQVYLEPLTKDSLSAIIQKEQPDGILPTLGGQTGLNLAVTLYEAGVLAQHNVELLGTSLDTIQKGEDRDIFKSTMKSIGEPVPESLSVRTTDDAVRFSETAGFPIIVRPAYTLGGAGGGVAETEQELISVVRHGLDVSPVGQVLVEQSIKGWKEIEYEVIRDASDNCIIVCDMENIDPAGIHTGDSIVVAPSQTLTDQQKQMLRSASFSVIRELGVIGGCNIQFALNPDSDEYVIIEVNPRVSRSSALASKATGYPIARVAAKIAMGWDLNELQNPMTGKTYAGFEPVLDYIAVKIPRWPFDKFKTADRTLGTQMKATGEVMALAGNLPAGLNKAIRSLDAGIDGFPFLTDWTTETIEQTLIDATDDRLFVTAEALRRGYSLDQVHELTGINHFFLNEIASVTDMENELAKKGWDDISRDEVRRAKAIGLSDKVLAYLFNEDLSDVKNRSQKMAPSFKSVDTSTTEDSVDLGYFYSTWHDANEALPMKGQKVVVLGSGPIRIGQGVEFDYCSVQASVSLQNQGIKAVVINNNPETVSTDYNMADHLYFEPLTAEDVLAIVHNEKADGVMVQFGGQTAINLAEELSQAGVHVYGTPLSAINAAEDRDEFYQLLKRLNIPHIPGETVTGLNEAVKTADAIGYPVLVRPSYVIGGSGMVVLTNEDELITYLNAINADNPDTSVFPVLVDRFIPGHEFEIDAVCDGEDVLIPGVFQHIERAGVHSGDSIAVFPAPELSKSQKQLIEAYTTSISAALNLKGMVNIQFVLSEDKEQLYVLEVNPRASRTVPIASKVTGIQLIDLAVQVQTGKPLNEQPWKLGLHDDLPYYAVKMPVFSSDKLAGVDPYLGPEMQSTGEAIGIGTSMEEALAKAVGWTENSLLAKQTEKPIYLSLGASAARLPQKLLSLLSDMTDTLAADQETADALSNRGVSVKQVISLAEARTICAENGFQLVCDTQKSFREDAHASLRTEALSVGTPCLTSAETLLAYVHASVQPQGKPVSINDYLDISYGLNKTKEQVV
ncbi:carbamoyl-phosphate synthase (glutamine-hydrolyzing) large subunit [Lentibacillus sp. CBA3610]|uniref:carbamoyl-phosphate synthase (glutamine-hydrolyzing) large subunit n=1 Tax=Lentibacillus sp. CBA3610 TaxID=2518176 RepID=UPI0015951FA1|nr:carbamoyl-phosphate synthase (glutamine-hydrolyzing) large subunit [Lentibacillus sp. CBA3610]QKY69825.1 carbamoyl-phosphate synthase (glutamine-hydrolyzing) large subunit [Lentibacillus sp. CBA3610]